MKKILFNKKLIIFFIFIVSPTYLLAANVGTINIAYILEQSASYNNFLDELTTKKLELEKTLNIKEKELTKLKEEIDRIKFIDEYRVDGDFVESQAFAYLAIRSYLKLPISFPETTGVMKPCTGGVIVKY